MRLCQPCLQAGRTTEAKEVDHIINRAAGGGESLENLQSICTPCHAEKTKREAMAAKSTRPVIGLDGWPITQGEK
jgi:5-methylcytosine-specific restriction protein A